MKSLTLPQTMRVPAAFHMDLDSLAAVLNHQRLKAVHTAPYNSGPLIPFLLAGLDFLPVQTMSC